MNPTQPSAAEDLSDREMVIEREIPAPRALVFEAWTSPEHLAAWWGPRGFTTTTQSYELRGGGTWKFVMHGPDGVDYPNRIIYREIVRPERIVYDHDAGEDDPHGFRVTTLFAEHDGRTRLTFRLVFATAEAYQKRMNFRAKEGGQQTLDRLVEYVATLAARAAGDESTQEVVISRLIAAPRQLVFDAWTDPAKLVQWSAPDGCTLEYFSIDVRPGGSFHHQIKTPTGFTCICKGEYDEIVPAERIAYTMWFADRAGNFVEPGEVKMDVDWPRKTSVIVTFVDEDGGTRLTLRQTLSLSIAKRTGAYPSWLQMLERLAGLVGRE